MTDDRHFPQSEDLPEWLKGHIHPYPGEEPASASAADEAPAPEAGAAAFDMGDLDLGDDDDLSFLSILEEEGGDAPDTGDAGLPWSSDEGADEDLPAAGDLKGLTGELPWLDDVVADSPAPDAPAADAGAADLAWLAAADDLPADQAPPAPAGDPNQFKGLTGELPWMDDSGRAPDAPGRSAFDDDLTGDALDWMAVPDDDGPQDDDLLSDGDLLSEDDLIDEEFDPLAIFGGDDDLPASATEDVRLPSIGATDAPVADWLADAPPVPDAPEAAAADDLPGWLDDDEPIEEATLPEPEPPAEEMPDWLSDTGMLDDADLEAAETAAPADAVPDWLQTGDLEMEDDYTPADQAPVEDAGAVPDWLDAAEEFVADEDDADYVPGAEAEPEADDPEWLIRDTGELPAELLDEEDDGLTYEEWQRQQDGEEEEPSVEETLAEEVPDWFTGMGDAPDDEAAAPAPESAPADEAEFVPDWFLGLEEQDTSEAPEWFGNLDFSADAITAQPVLPEEPAPAPEAPEAAPAEPAPEPGDVPDWFADMGAPAAPEAAAEPAEDVPDWFADMGIEAPAEPPAPAASAAEVDLPDLPDLSDEAPVDEPDWLAEFDDAAAAEPEAPAASMPDTGDLLPGDSPDWLDDLDPDMPLGTDAPTTEGLLDGGEDFMSVIEGELASSNLMPELGVGDDAALLSADSDQFDFDAMLADAGLPPVDEEDEALPGMELGEDAPEWLAQARPPSGVSSVSAVGMSRRQMTDETPEEELSDRLKVLRQRTQAVAADEGPAASEAGEELTAASEVLSGVTDALAPISAVATPEGPSVMLDVALDEAQQARVATLSGLLGLDQAMDLAYDEDGEPLPVDHVAEAERIRAAAHRARARSRRKPDRLIVMLLLAVAVVLPFFVDLSGLIDLPVAALEPAVHGSLDAAIEALEPGSRVLVGFEYGPTAAGELDTLAEPLLTHILLRGGVPVVVSTNPAGILHARDVLDALAQDEFLLAHLGRAADDPLVMNADYYILPYLPGGAVGLRSLTATSTDTSALDRGVWAVDLEGNPTGLDIGLMQVSFDLILTLAERGEDVRLWVEQVSTPVSLPLAAAVSAAAEPVSRPYFDSGQLIGLLAGYRDAYIYDRVLLASLGPVYSGGASLPEDQAPVAAGDDAEATAVPALAQGLVTNTPQPSATPTITVTPSETPLPSATPTEAPELEDDDLTATAEVEETPTIEPTATERVFITATPEPAEGEDTTAPEAAAEAGDVELLTPDRTYQEARWYSTTLGALVATGVIGLGAIVNIIRGIRRRRDQ
jgi:hypothetical protein